MFQMIAVRGQTTDADTLYFKNDTIYQELIIEKINETTIHFVLSSYKIGEQYGDMHKGYASISEYAYLASETDIADDGSLYPVIEYWYKDELYPLSIRVNYDMGVATISFAKNLSLPYIYRLKKK